PWIARGIELLRQLGPYAAIELLLPGGSLIALLLWLYRRRAVSRASTGRGGMDRSTADGCDGHRAFLRPHGWGRAAHREGLRGGSQTARLKEQRRRASRRGHVIARGSRKFVVQDRRTGKHDPALLPVSSPAGSPVR